MRIIGLTGGIATGKSTVANMFKERGAKIISADQLVHQLLEPGTASFRRVKAAFGPQIMSAGKIDRKKLARIVFNDKGKLRKLERIIHPQVRKRIRRKISEFQKNKRIKVVVVEIPLLYEARFENEVEATVVVVSSRQLQIKRAVRKLGITKNEALRRIGAQMSLKNKIRLADFIIDNNSTKNNTKKQVKELWQKLQ